MASNDPIKLREFIKKLDERIKELEQNLDSDDISELDLYDLGFMAMDVGQGTIDKGTASDIFDIADHFDSSPRRESLDKLKDVGKIYDV